LAAFVLYGSDIIRIILQFSGTIMNPSDAERAMDAGSEFIITPVMLPDVIDWCAKRNIVCVPGCQTPTELHMAYMCGAPLQKLFPGVAGGPMWVKAVSSALVRHEL
jgi:2-dehydro-3-deoxyphosphogluconate aldolase / (4S)-4-hydroxy-2-oxoglutarate aldolase